MKSIFTIIAAILLQVSFAQRYDLTQANLPFTPLTDATTLTLPQDWDDEEVTFNLPFSYSFYGTPASNLLYITTNAAFANASLDIPEPPSNTLILFGGAYDLIQKPNTTVKYKIEGTAPNRKFTVEFLNAGLFDVAPENGNINIQNTISENGCFSIHLGEASSTDEFALSSAIFGIYAVGKDSIAFGQAEGTSLVYTESKAAVVFDNESVYVDVYPGANKFFEFCPITTVSTAKVEEKSFSVYPNPAIHSIQFDAIKNNSMITFYDYTGKMVKQLNQVNAQEQIDVTDLISGIYLLKLTSKDGSVQTITLSKK